MVFSAILVILAGIAPGPSPGSQADTVLKVNLAIQRGLSYFEQSMTTWNQKQTCVSCHNALPVLWSLNQLSQKGFAVPKPLFEDWRKRAQAIKRRVPAESLAYFVLADPQRRDVADLGQQLESERRADGTWRPGGQRILQARRDKNSNRETSVWAVLALAQIEKNATRTDLDSISGWLDIADASTTEQVATVLLLSRQYNLKDVMDHAVQQLQHLQDEDGGWGWNKSSKSDVIATGQALFALSGVGEPGEVLNRGRHFILSQQKDNGSWVTSEITPSWDSDLTKHSVYWSTAWALMGISGVDPGQVSGPVR